jgi:hypothetical protein
MKAFKNLYLAITEQDNLFKQSESIKIKKKYLYDEEKHAQIDENRKKNMKKNRAIYIPIKDYILLFLSQLPICFFFKFCWPKY